MKTHRNLKNIKHNGGMVHQNCRDVHLEALNEVDEVIGTNYSRSCEIP